jgi:uncharacterized membrane protein YgaE (UPF0421/DUF939 family)
MPDKPRTNVPLERQMTSRHFEALIYSSKAACAAVCAMIAAGLLGSQGGVWAAVSAVIVTQPSLHPSVKASLMRVLANLIGAFIGSALSSLIGHSVPAMAFGVLFTGLVCYLWRLEDALRPAYVAVVIVILGSNAPNAWLSSLDRLFAVILGCLAALAVGFVYDKTGTGFGNPPQENSSPTALHE